MAKKDILNRNLVAVFHDAVMSGLSFMLAFYLRFGADFVSVIPVPIEYPAIIFMFITLIVLMSMRLYRGLWRYASMQDLVAIAKAVSIAVVVFYLGFFFFNRGEGIPRSVILIHWLVLLAMLGGPRFLYRVAKDRLVGRRFSFRDDHRIPVLIVGANPDTEHFLRETERNRHSPYRVVGILDEDTSYHGQVMHGMKIYGGLDVLSVVVKKLERRGDTPQRVILSDINLDGAAVRDLLDQADRFGMSLARLPRLTELKSNMTESYEIRPIAVEDLLGRAQNVHDKSQMAKLVAGKRVMVTGAGGTIGSELVRQLAEFGPAAIYLLEHSEFSLYQIDQELDEDFSSIPRQAILADVRDGSHLLKIFEELRPHIVFHSAAIKHVPIAEYNPEEAILTNVIGTQNVADACVKTRVAAMVLISTDKAVNPANVMGATKRLAETYCQALGNDVAARGNTRFITVRFGNVLASTGSVVPLFERQLKRGGPITVTHPDMTRYFMTVREAVELVLEATAMGARPEEPHHGLIYVLDMGEPVRIEELALQMIRLAGLKPHDDIEIVYTGLRPGEKLFEELFHYSESSVKTDHVGIMLANSRRAEYAKLTGPMDELHASCQRRDLHEALMGLQKLVPEFGGAAKAEHHREAVPVAEKAKPEMAAKPAVKTPAIAEKPKKEAVKKEAAKKAAKPKAKASAPSKPKTKPKKKT